MTADVAADSHLCDMVIFSRGEPAVASNEGEGRGGGCGAHREPARV